MWSIWLSPAEDERDKVLAELWEAGTLGILEESAGLRAYFEVEETARVFGDARAETMPAVLSEAQEWEPVYAGGKFVIIPKGKAGLDDCDGRIELEVNAAMAFGSGRHETTQLCLEALEIYMTPGAAVLDVGCGSGILSMAAQKLGAGRVIACDIQEDAVQTAREHFGGALFQGSADGISDGFADLVLANISGRINDRIAGDLRRVLKPEGVLVLSGFIAENPPQCFRPDRELVRGEWLCWICRAEGIQPGEAGENVHSHPQNWF